MDGPLQEPGFSMKKYFHICELQNFLSMYELDNITDAKKVIFFAKMCLAIFERLFLSCNYFSNLQSFPDYILSLSKFRCYDSTTVCIKGQ